MGDGSQYKEKGTLLLHPILPSKCRHEDGGVDDPFSELFVESLDLSVAAL